MRILRLVDDGTFAVEFHPFITVVAGVSDELRDKIVQTFEQAASGRACDLRGLIEVHGVVLDLDERALDLLELEDGEIETCVTATDLPGNASSGVGRQVRAAERRLEALEQPHRDRLLRLSAAEATLEEALASEVEARAEDEQTSAAAIQPATVAEDADARSELVERRAALQLERDRLFATLDPAAAVALDAALAALESVTTADEEGSADHTEEPTVEEVSDLVGTIDPAAMSDAQRSERLAELRTTLSLHRLYDPSPVRDALDDVRAVHATGETVQSTEALSLADRLHELDREIAELDELRSEDSTPTMVEAAQERVEQARLALAERERDVAAQTVGPGDIALLEDVHAEVERAREALDGRFGRAKAQRRLDEARAVEDEVLEQLGLHSYTEFLTQGGSVGPASAPSAELDRARDAVAEAEDELRSLERSVDASLSQAELVEERRHARDQARALLGDPDLNDEAITTELLKRRVPTDELGPVDGLVDGLAAVGLPVGDLDLTRAELEAMAADWLAEYQHTEARLLQSIDVLESPAKVVTLDIDELALDDVADDTDAAPTPLEDPSADAREAVQVAKARVVEHEEATAALAEVEAALVEVEAELAELAELQVGPSGGVDDGDDETNRDVGDSPDALSAAAASVAVAQGAVDAAKDTVDSAQTEYDAAVEELAVLRQTVSELDVEPPAVSEIEWYLLARLAAQRQQSFVGSLPLVIAGALDGVTDDDGLVHLLDRLERMAGAVQIVHITDDSRIIKWADALAEDRAAVVRPVAARSGAV